MRASSFGALAALGLVAASAAACDDPARPIPPAPGGSLFVSSDPAGAEIFIDDVRASGLTPTVLLDIPEGAHTLRLELDSAGSTYAYQAGFLSTVDSQTVVRAPLTLRCSNMSCAADAFFANAPENVQFALSAAGPPFTLDGLAGGVVWPTGSGNSYVGSAAVVVAAREAARQHALGVRNYAGPLNYWAGRPVPSVGVSGGTYVVDQTTWIVPSLVDINTVRGLAVEQQVFVVPAHPDAVLVRAKVRNISTDSLYRALDPALPETGIAFADVWVGLAMNPDVGVSSGESNDDLVAHVPAQRLVFTYDATLSVPSYSSGWTTRPGLVGLALLGPVANDVRQTAWPMAADWRAGESSTTRGYDILSGMPTTLTDHPLPQVGFAPDSATSDYLMSVASGPYTLAPGDSVVVQFALVMAAPEPGTFTTGALLPAGDPANPDRPATQMAGTLISRVNALQSAFGF